MPQVSCAVYKCTNNSKKLRKIKAEICSKHKKTKGECGCLPFSHFKFPKEDVLKDKWTTLINRQTSTTDKTPWIPDDASVVCSIHFKDGRPTDTNPLPTLNMGYNINTLGTLATTKPRKLPKRGSMVTESETMISTASSSTSASALQPEMTTVKKSTAVPELTEDSKDSADFNFFDVLPPINNEESFSDITVVKKTIKQEPTEETSSNHINCNKIINNLKGKYFTKQLELKSKTHQLKLLTNPLHQQLFKKDQDVQFYTGIPNMETFKIIIKYLNEWEKMCRKPSKKGAIYNVKLKYKQKNLTEKNKPVSLVLADKVLLVLMKLRLDLLHKDLADRFRITITDVSTIFSNTVKMLANALSPLITFYTQNEISQTLPKEYRSFKKLRCIIDCSEIFIQRPSDLKMQAATWSDYKSHNTIKFLIAITPQGSIAYLSELYGGRTSDRHIVRDCGFLNYINPQDQILADRGFGLKEEFLLKNAVLVIPPAAKGTSQMTSTDIRKTKTVANVRIHVERVIRRMKCFKFIGSTVSITMLRYCNDIIKIIAAITNLQGPIVKDWSTTSQE